MSDMSEVIKLVKVDDNSCLKKKVNYWNLLIKIQVIIQNIVSKGYLYDPLVLLVCSVCFIWSSWQMSVPIHQAGECLCQFKFLHFAHCCFMENDEKWTTCLPWYEHSMTLVEHLRLAHSTSMLSGIFSTVLVKVEVTEVILIQTPKFLHQSQFSLNKVPQSDIAQEWKTIVS